MRIPLWLDVVAIVLFIVIVVLIVMIYELETRDDGL